MKKAVLFILLLVPWLGARAAVDTEPAAITINARPIARFMLLPFALLLNLEASLCDAPSGALIRVKSPGLHGYRSAESGVSLMDVNGMGLSAAWD